MNRSIDRVWHYMIDSEGQVWHDGVLFDDPSLLKFFMEKMEVRADGRFHVICQGEECILEADDAPYVVQDLEIEAGPLKQSPLLIFAGGYQERLDPRTLFVGQENVLYCRVRKGKFVARFNRKSYRMLAEKIEFNPKGNIYYLRIGDKACSIKVSQEK